MELARTSCCILLPLSSPQISLKILGQSWLKSCANFNCGIEGAWSCHEGRRLDLMISIPVQVQLPGIPQSIPARGSMMAFSLFGVKVNIIFSDNYWKPIP